MSTLGVAQLSTELDTPYRGDARAWQLLQELLDGKLDIQTLCQRHQIRFDEVQGWLRERHRSALMAFDAQLKRALIRRGASPEALVGPELSVSLADVALLDWIQAIQIVAKEAVITVLHAEGESRIWCAQGAVIDASSGRLRGEAAFHRIAALEHGQVVTELRAVHRERTIRASPTSLMLDSMRRKDELALLERKIGGLDRHYQCSGEPMLNRSLNTAQASLLRLFDQPRRLADVLAESEIGDIETLAALDGLIRAGQLVETTPSRPTHRPERGNPSEHAKALEASLVPISFAWPQAGGPQRSNWRWAASTLAMGLLVSGAAWTGTQLSLAKARAPVVAAPPAAATPVVYSVAVRAEPIDAELRVDGQVVGRGVWATTLPRDGAAHELYASADGFIPLRLIFVDTPPPRDLRLEPLAAISPPAAQLVPPTAPGVDARASSAEAARQRKGSPQGRQRLSRPAGNRAATASASATPPAQPKRPFVQIIDGDEPRAQPR